MTLGELNQRIWYRLLKVVYSLAFLLAALYGTALVVVENQPRDVLDRDASQIVCATKRKFISILGEVALVPEDKIEAFLTEMGDEWKEQPAGSPSAGMPLSHSRLSVPDYEFDPKSVDGIASESARAQLKAFCRSAVKVNLHYTTIGSWAGATGYAFAFLSVLLLLYECGRRLFYYVVLGRYRPKI